MKIDNVIARIKASEKLSDGQKARLIRICERIRLIILAMRRAIHGTRDWMRAHKTFIGIMVVALVLAIILSHIPIVGQVLAMLALLVGAVVGALKQVQASLEEILGLA